MRYTCKVFDRSDKLIGCAMVDQHDEVTLTIEQANLRHIMEVAGAYADDVSWVVQDENGMALYAGSNA